MLAMDPEETKVIYHVGEEETPYRVKVSVAPSRVTLGDLRTVVKRDGYKFFFKAKDDDFGWVSTRKGERIISINKL